MNEWVHNTPDHPIEYSQAQVRLHFPRSLSVKFPLLTLSGKKGTDAVWKDGFSKIAQAPIKRAIYFGIRAISYHSETQ